MSATSTATATRRDAPLLVRGAVPADYPAIGEVVAAACARYADLMPPGIFSAYLADLLDLETHARRGRLLAAEVDEQVRGFAVFYPVAPVRGFGLPHEWASGRALAVHPAARGHAIARAMLAACEYLARQAAAPVLVFHPPSIMTDAIALYERLGYTRAPEFDFDVASRFGQPGAVPIGSIAYLRHLTRTERSPAVHDAHSVTHPGDQ
jgi:GNAT superfamily N-acetyltransferase